MSSEELHSQGARGSTWVHTYLLPLAVLVVVAAIASVLILTGVVKSDQPRVGPGEAPTTRPTVEVVP